MNRLLPGWCALLVASISLANAAAGCHHIIEPTNAPLLTLEEGEETLFSGSSLRLDNGHQEAQIRNLKADGSHQLAVDLREWTARLLLELEVALEARGAEVCLWESELTDTTFIRLGREPKDHAQYGRDFPVLQVTVTEVVPPDFEARRGPALLANVEAGADYSASYRTDRELNGFSEAFLDLKGQIVADAQFRRWLAR